MKSTYNLLEKKANGILTSYREDLTKWDKNQLENYHGSFYWYLRSSGTFLARNEISVYSFLRWNNNVCSINLEDSPLVYNNVNVNQIRYYYDHTDNTLKQISREELILKRLKQLKRISLFRNNKNEIFDIDSKDIKYPYLIQQMKGYNFNKIEIGKDIGRFMIYSTNHNKSLYFNFDLLPYFNLSIETP